jgi:hypothetical protein
LPPEFWGRAVPLSDEKLQQVVAAKLLAQRREAKRERRRKAKAMLSQLVKDVRQAEESRIQLFEQRYEVKIGKSKKTGAYFIVSFKDAWKVPIQFVSLLLKDECLWRLPRRQQHALMVPKALRALAVDQAEEVSEKLWNKPLEEYQLGPIREQLINHGYHPTDKQRTVAHFLKLLKAGKGSKSDSEAQTFVGVGDNQVSFSTKKTMHFRERTYSVQWRGDSPRVKLNGRLMSVWSVLEGAGHDKRTIIDISDNAEKRYQAEQAARLQAEKEASEMDALFDEIDNPLAGIGLPAKGRQIPEFERDE